MSNAHFSFTLCEAAVLRCSILHLLCGMCYNDDVLIYRHCYEPCKSNSYKNSIVLFDFSLCDWICRILIFPLMFVIRDEIGALVDELVDNTKKLVSATTREIDKWTK